MIPKPAVGQTGRQPTDCQDAEENAAQEDGHAWVPGTATKCGFLIHTGKKSRGADKEKEGLFRKEVHSIDRK